MTPQEYFNNFITEYEITEEQNTILLQPDADNYEQKPYKYFSVSNKTKFEGISILYPSLDGVQYEIAKPSNSKKGIATNNKQTFSRICLLNREPQSDGSIKKYHSPKKAKTIYDQDGNEIENQESLIFPFWTPDLLDAFKNKTKVPQLGMIEGEKKAFKAFQHGFKMLGLGSKDGFSTNGVVKKLNHDIERFINNCEVEELCLVLDADTLTVKPEHLKEKKDLYNRAYSFYNTVNNFRTIVSELMRKCPTLRNCYFLHLLPDYADSCKGLDDLLIENKTKATEILHDYMQKDKAESFFGGFNVIQIKDLQLKDYFGIGYHDSWYKAVNSFYQVYHKSLDKQDFVFRQHVYYFDDEKGSYQRQQSEISNGCVSYNMQDYFITVQGKQGNYTYVTEGFLIFIKYLTVDERERNTWILEIRQKEKPEMYLEITHDEFHDARAMEKIFSARRLAISLNESLLKNIRNFLLTHSETTFSDAKKILRYGLHEESELFFFGNVAITKQGKLLYPDEFGIINHNNFNLSMPQIGKNKETALYQYTENEISFNRWYKLLKDAQREEMSFIVVSWFINTIFRDIATKFIKFSPILFLTGIAGTTKSTLFRHLLYCFAPDTKELEMNIKGKNTNPAFTAKLEQRMNGFLFLDEYKPNHDLEDAFQASYDNKAYSKMDMGKGGYETLDLVPKTSLGIASNFKPQLPQSEPLFTRMVLMINNVRKLTPERKQAFNELIPIQEKGLGCIIRELWANRDLIKNNYMTAYHKILKAIEAKTVSEKDILPRLLSNLAITLTPAYILHTNGKIQICEFSNEKEVLDFFADQAYTSIMASWRMMSDKSTLREFFEIIQDLFDKGALIEGFHYKFLKGDTILLNFRKLHFKYAEEYRRMTRFELAAPLRTDIEDEIMVWAGYEVTDETAKQSFFTKQRMKPDHIDMDEKEFQNGCCKLDYQKLNHHFSIDFKKSRWDKNNVDIND